MSLTGQLATGALGRWCADTLTGTARVAAEVAADVATAATATTPIRPRRVDGPGHWATVGGAFGQRLAFAAQHAPPYPALLGAHSAGFSDWATADRAAAAFPTHTDRSPGALQRRPLPGGGWVDLDTGPTADTRGRATTGTRPALLLDLAHHLARFLTEHAPPGQLANTRGAETVLARACVVLTDLETAYRAGAPTDDTAILWAADDTTVDTLLADVPTATVDELVELATRAHTAGVLARLAPGIAAPVFIEHWAEGDVLIPADGRAADSSDPTGCTLLDVKTVMSARDPHKVARWLWQLLGYAWLDHAQSGRHHVTRVGLYFARHGHTITWAVDDLAAQLLDDTDPGPSRTAFRHLAFDTWRWEAGRSHQPP